MTLDAFRPLAERILAPFVSAADSLGLTPNSVSVLSLLVAGAAAAAFVAGEPLWYAVGGVLVLLNGWLDLVDGALAREQGVASKAGDLLDHVIDRYADLIIIGGLAAGVENFALGFSGRHRRVNDILPRYTDSGRRAWSGLRRARRPGRSAGVDHYRRLRRGSRFRTGRCRLWRD